MRVGILGGGRWGQALGRLVMAAGNEPFIAYRDRRERPPHILPSTDDPPRVSEACELLIAATSASALREAIRLAKPGPQNRIVIAGRGIEPSTGLRLSEVIEQECDAVRLGALAGPAPVEEILNGALCAGVVASPYEDVRRLTTQALHSSRYRVYETDDLTGVELAGAVVPVLATLIGFATNLQGSGVGIHAMVLARGLAEASRLARGLGADPATLAGLAGIGDLVAAQSLPSAPYYKSGANLARGKRDAGPELLARALVRQAGAMDIELPLIEGLVAIYDGMEPLEMVTRLMTRQAQAERA